MEKDRYKTANLKNTAHLRLAKYLLFDALSVAQQDTNEFLVTPGSSPFYAGAQFIADDSLCQYFRGKFETAAGDTPGEMEFKQTMRRAYNTFTGGHAASDRGQFKLYNDLKVAKNFLSDLWL